MISKRISFILRKYVDVRGANDGYVLKLLPSGFCNVQCQGYIMSLPYLIPGETIKYHTDEKNKYIVDDIVKRSDSRVTPFCPYFSYCSGCALMHIRYSSQVLLKLSNYKKLIDKQFLRPIISPSTYNYSSNVILNITSKAFIQSEDIKQDCRITNCIDYTHRYVQSNPDFSIGYFVRNKKLKSTTPIDSCSILLPTLNEIYKYTYEALKATFTSPKDIPQLLDQLRISLCKSDDIELMIHFKLSQLFFEQQWNFFHQNFCKILFSIVPNELKQSIKSIVASPTPLNSNKHPRNQEIYTIYGNKFIYQVIRSVKLKVSPWTFFISHYHQLDNFYNILDKFLNLNQREVIYNFDCENGSLVLPFAKNASFIYGFDDNIDNLNDSYDSAKLNNITNCEFIHLDQNMSKELDQNFFNGFKKPDIVIYMCRIISKQRIPEFIINLKPKKVIYISNFVQSIVSDTQYLSKYYTLTTIQPIDLCPHKSKMECLCLLTLKD